MKRTISTILLDGTPDGVWKIEMGTQCPCQLYVIPRSQINEIEEKEQKKLRQYCFYILLGNGKAYIGQTEDFLKRVKDHLNNKDFWNEALVFVSKNNDIYASEVFYLEHLGITKAKQANRFSLINDVIPHKKSLSESKEIEMEAFFGDICLLTSFYHCPLFEEKEGDKDVEEIDDNSIPNYLSFALEMKYTSARINYFPEQGKYVVLAGSTVRKHSTDSFDNKNAIVRRKEVFGDNTWSKQQGDSMILLRDVEFDVSAPNIPVQFCTGRSTNATEALKDENGVSYKNLFANSDGVIQTIGSPAPANQLITFKDKCIQKIKDIMGTEVKKKNSSSYVSLDGKTGFVFRTSKIYQQGKREKFWYAYKRSKEIAECKNQYYVFGCQNENTIILMPISEIEAHIEGLNYSKDANDNPLYWHVVFLKDEQGKMTWLISKPNIHEIDITNKLLK